MLDNPSKNEKNKNRILKLTGKKSPKQVNEPKKGKYSDESNRVKGGN
jgi:hypothetical protein